MPVARDRMRCRLAVCREAFEIGDDLLHQVKICDGRMTRDAIDEVESVNGAGTADAKKACDGDHGRSRRLRHLAKAVALARIAAVACRIIVGCVIFAMHIEPYPSPKSVAAANVYVYVQVQYPKQCRWRSRWRSTTIRFQP
jgi:hypothetical protein